MVRKPTKLASAAKKPELTRDEIKEEIEKLQKLQKQLRPVDDGGKAFASKAKSGKK